MSIEVMKQALEALEYHRDQTRPIYKTQKTIETLRQAIKVENALREITMFVYEMQSKEEK